MGDLVTSRGRLNREKLYPVNSRRENEQEFEPQKGTKSSKDHFGILCLFAANG
jgi:hypothetical protein